MAEEPLCPIDSLTLCSTRTPGVCHITTDIVVRHPLTAPHCAWRGLPSERLEISPSVQIVCFDPSAVGGAACSLSLHWDAGITVRAGALLRAGSLRLSTSGRLLVEAGAKLSADGMGRCGWSGSGGALDSSGAAHGGAGGDCFAVGERRSKAGVPYGDGTLPYDAADDLRPEFEVCQCASYGAGTSTSISVGELNSCCGGGLVLINASAGLQLDGVISADAQAPCRDCHLNITSPPPPHALPCCDPRLLERVVAPCNGVGGAAGGTVQIHMGGSLPINGTGAVSARGGNGSVLSPAAAGTAVRQQSGGGGGRVFMSHCPTTLSVDVSGGLPSDVYQCNGGGSGTVFYEQCGSGGGAQLRMDNRQHARGVFSTVADGEPRRRIRELRLSNGATLRQLQGANVSAAARVLLSSNAAVELSCGQFVVAPVLQVLSSSAVRAISDSCPPSLRAALDLGTQAQPLTGLSLEVDTLSELVGLGSIWSRGTARIGGRVHSTTGIAIDAPQLEVRVLASISAPTIDVVSSEVQIDGKLQADMVVDMAGGACPSKVLRCDGTLLAAEDACGYPLQLRSRILIMGTGGIVAASEVLLCTNRTQIFGMVTAKGLGFPANAGMHPGCYSDSSGAAPQSAASGGGHGGKGGDSARVHNLSGCAGGKAYGDRFAPGRLGSGGGGANGGAGGGVVHLEALEQLSVLDGGVITVDGSDALPDVGEIAGGGSGGGAGGSIWLRSPSFSFLGAGVYASGGSGGAPGGGGGGAGLIHVEPAADLASSWSLEPSAAEISGYFASFGGFGGTNEDPNQPPGEAGDNMPLSGPNCTAGRTGVFCQPCAAGASKPARGRQPCASCAPGKFSSAGARRCSTCPPGSYSGRGAASCAPCAPGTWGGAWGATACAACDAGRHAATWGAVNCSACAPGMTAARGAANCSWCAVGYIARPNGTACAPCESKPRFSFYTGPRNTCDWACADERFRAADGACRLLIELLLPSEVGGGLVALLPLCLSLVLLLWIALSSRRSKRRHRPPPSTINGPSTSEDTPADPFPAWGSSRLLPFERSSSAFGLMNSPKLESLQHALMWEKHKYRAKQHVARLYLSGHNSILHPWQLPPLPPELRRLIKEDAYYDFSENFSRAAEWSQWELIVHWLLSFFLPPTSIHFLSLRRWLHWQRVQRIVQALGHENSEALWRSVYTRVWEVHQLELTCCAQLQLGWVDVFANVGGLVATRTGASLLEARAPAPPPPNNSPCRPLAPPPSDSVHRTSTLREPSIGSQQEAVRLGGATLSVTPDGNGDARPAEGKDSASKLRALPRRLFTGISPESQPREELPRLQPLSICHMASADWQGADSPADTPGAQWESLQTYFPNGLPTQCSSGMPQPCTTARRPSTALDELGAASCRNSSIIESGLDASPSRRQSERSASEHFSNHLLSRASSEPRIEHRLSLLGEGSYLCPYWIELSDFVVYDAITSAVDVGAAAVVAALNARLQRVQRRSRNWRQSLRALLDLIEAISRQLSEADPSSEGCSDARSLALVHMPAQGPHRRLALMIGQGDPMHWRLPLGCSLLRAADCETLTLPDFCSRPLFVEVALGFLFGSFPPIPMPTMAACALLSVLLSELVLSTLVLSSLCSLPNQMGGCLATALVFPLAGILSPVISLVLLAHTAYVWRGVARGQETALCRASSGYACRLLRMGAVWNVVSLPNAIVAQIAFVMTPPFVEEYNASKYVWMLPLVLLCTKFLGAQAIKVVIASIGVSPSVWAILESVDGNCRAILANNRRTRTQSRLARLNSLARRSE